MSQSSKGKATTVSIPNDAIKNVTVDDLYDKDKYDLATMEEEDVFKLLEYNKLFFYLRNIL